MPTTNSRLWIIAAAEKAGDFLGAVKLLERYVAAFPKAGRPLQKAFLNTDPVIIGAITQGNYDKYVAKTAAVAEHVHLLEVTQPSVEETISTASSCTADCA